MRKLIILSSSVPLALHVLLCIAVAQAQSSSPRRATVLARRDGNSAPNFAKGEGEEQRVGLRVLKSYQISTASPTLPHVESFLAIDPRDPKHLIAAAMVGRANGETGTNVYVSFDGGRRWTPSKGIARSRSSGDPIVYITREGTALFAIGTRVADRSATTVSRSTDGGRTWGHPLALHYRDRSFMAFDTTGGKLDGTIYFGGQYGSLLFSRSADDARSFSFPEVISRDLGGSDPTMPIGGVLTDMLVTPEGHLVMPFIGALDPRAPNPKQSDSMITMMLRVLVSDDGGRSFFAMRDGPQVRLATDFRVRQVISAERAAIDQSSGQYRGRLYLVFPDWDAPRGAYVVRLAWSADLGKTWKTTVVNDNTDGRDPGNPALAVSRDGIVGVIWNDRRDDSKNTCWRLYGAVSTNGGETFLPNAKLSDAPTCTNARGNWVLNTWYQYDNWTRPEQPRPGFGLTALVPVRFPNGGDTQGLVTDADGVFHAAWINGVTGTLQLWYTAFAVNPQIVADVRARNAAHTTNPSVEPVPVGKIDVTQELAFEMSAPKIDFQRGMLEVTMRVVNPTTRPIRGPIDVVVDRLMSNTDKAMGLENFRVANADNGKDSVGATWTFAVGSGDLLAPKGKTPPRVLRFSFTGGIPEKPEGYFEPAFRIYALLPAARQGVRAPQPGL